MKTMLDASNEGPGQPQRRALPCNETSNLQVAFCATVLASFNERRQFSLDSIICIHKCAKFLEELTYVECNTHAATDRVTR